MSHLQRHLSNLKSLSLSPESLLSSSLTVFQEIGRDLSHHTTSDKNTLRKYYQFLVECYKLIDKNLLAPDYLQSITLSQTSDRIVHLVKQFIMVWTMINQDQEELLTLKLWINFLQKANILKADREVLWLSRIFLEAFYPQILDMNRNTPLKVDIITAHLGMTPHNEDLKLPKNLAIGFGQTLNYLVSNTKSLNTDSLRILANCVLLRTANLTNSEAAFCIATMNDWDILVGCYEAIRKLYQVDTQRVAELYNVYYKDYFKMIYKFSGLAVEKKLMDTQKAWRIRIEGFSMMIQDKAMDYNDLGCYLIDTLSKITKDDTGNEQKHTLAIALYHNITKALFPQGKRPFQTRNILSFYYKLLTYCEETYEEGHFLSVLSIIFHQGKSDLPLQSFYDIEFWRQNLTKAHYLPSIISWVLTKVMRSYNHQDDTLIGTLFTNELSFCVKSVKLLMSLKLLNEGQKEAGNQDYQLDHMMSRLTRVYNNFEKVKMSVLSAFLNKRNILAKVESQNDTTSDNNVLQVIQQIREKDGLNTIPDLLEIHSKLFKILLSKESNSSTRILTSFINNKFYKILYLIVLYIHETNLADLRTLRKGIQEYTSAISSHREAVEDPSFRKELQSSINYVTKVIEVMTNSKKKRRDFEDITYVLEDLINLLNEHDLLRKFELRTTLSICTNLYKALKGASETCKASTSTLFSLHKSISMALEKLVQAHKTYNVEEKDSFYRLFEVLVRVEATVLRGNSSTSSSSSTPMINMYNIELETENFECISLLKENITTVTRWTYDKGSSLKKLHLRGRIKVLMSLWNEETTTCQEILGLLQLIGEDLYGFIENSRRDSNNFRELKYRVLWIEVLYVVVSGKQELQEWDDNELERLSTIVWEHISKVGVGITKGNKANSHEEALLKILKDDVTKQLEKISDSIGENKTVRYYLMMADVQRKMVYLHVYVGLHASEESKSLEDTVKNTAVMLYEFRNSLSSFQKALKLATVPQADFQDYMNTWLSKKSQFRAAFVQLLQHMKLCEVLKVQKLLSSYMEMAEYLNLLDETENLLKIMLVYWISLGGQLGGAFDVKTRSLFNTRVQLTLGVTQLKLSLLYHKKHNVQDREKCYKNFESCFQRDKVNQAIEMLQGDPYYQPFVTEIKGLVTHLDSLINEYKIRTNHPNAIDDFKTYLAGLERDFRMEKSKPSYAYMFLKVKLLLYSGQILYFSGYPAYSIQETRKCLDYLINYGFNYTQSQAVDQILSKEMECKPDRFSRICLVDLKSLNEASQLMKELCKPCEGGNATNIVSITNIVNMLFPKSLALNYSKLNMLRMVSKAMQKLSKISYNIGLLHYSEYYLNIFREYTLKTSQVIRYLNMYAWENKKKQGNDILLGLQKEDRLLEINTFIDSFNVLACPLNSQQKVLSGLKKSFSCTKDLLSRIEDTIRRNTWLDSTWKSTLIDAMVSLLRLYSAGKEGDEETSGCSGSSFRENELPACGCTVLKEFIESQGEFIERRLFSKDWFKQEHAIYEAKSFEVWQKVIQVINSRVNEFSDQDNYDIDCLVWLENCIQILSHIIFRVSLLHTPLTKQALLLRQSLMTITKKAIVWIATTKSYYLLENLEILQKARCSCGEYSWMEDIGIGEGNIITCGGGFNREIDFWLTHSDTVFTYKHQIKNIRKVIKAKKQTDNKDELKYLRKSIKTMRLHEEEGNLPDLSLILNLKDNTKRKFEEFSIKSQYLLQNMDKLLGNNPVVVVKFIKKKNQKMLFIAKVFPDSKRNVSFVIDDLTKTNFLSDLLLDFSKIISNIEKDLDATAKESAGEKGAKGVNASQWWKERFALDKRMETLVKSLEGIIEPYKGFILGDYIDEMLNMAVEKDVQELGDLLFDYVRHNVDERALRVVEKGLKKEMHAYVHLLKGLLLLSVDEKYTSTQFTRALEELCGDYMAFKIITEAQRADYIAKIVEFRTNLVQFMEGKNLKRKPVMLLLDEHFQFVPFECLPTFLSIGQNFLRIPSFEYIRSIYHEEKSVDMQNTFYVLNPSKDLKRTQQKFQEFFQRKDNWQGIIGYEPTKQHLKQALTQNDCYLYIGHGAGEKYFNEGELRDIMKIRSAVFLIGCSSAKQVKAQNYTSKGEAELTGISMEYLLCNCPFLVGNLWDVTDKDMDGMTEYMLEAMTVTNSVTDLLEVIQQARNRCKMKYLNGSALICYGLPLSFTY